MSEFEYPSGNDRKEEKKKERKFPEFVYVEEKQEWRQEGPTEGPQGDFFRSAREMKSATYSLPLRILCVLGSWVMFALALFFLFFCSFFLLINIVTFFQLHELWEKTRKLWVTIKKMLVIAAGLLVSAFNPAFGFAIIMVYFLLLGQSMDEEWATRILKSRFYGPKG